MTLGFSPGSIRGLSGFGGPVGRTTIDLMRADRRERLLYTIEEAAELLSLSRAQIYRLIDTMELESVTVGRSRRITAQQLDAFVRSLEAKAGSPWSSTHGVREQHWR